MKYHAAAKAPTIAIIKIVISDFDFIVLLQSILYYILIIYIIYIYFIIVKDDSL